MVNYYQGKGMHETVKRLGVLASLMLFSIAHAYNPPIGIPAPSFGIDEQAPSWPAGWPSSPVNNYYYIDNTHTSATDVNNPNGYPDKPRMSFPAGPFAAGTYIEMSGGPYTSLLFPKFNCTVSAPCWLRGSDINNKTIFQGAVGAPSGISIQDSSYLIIENLDMNGGYGGFGVGGNNTHHISIRNSSVRNKPFPGNNTSSLPIVPKNGGTVRDIVVYNMTFTALGNWQATVDEDYHAVLPSLWGRDSTASIYNIWFLDSTCINISGNCIQVNAGNWNNSYQYLHHIYIGRITAHDNRQSGLGFKQCRDVVASENVIYNQRRAGAQPGSAIVMQYGQDNIWLIHNTLSSSNYGIRQSDTPPSASNFSSYFVGNTIHDIHPQDLSTYIPTDKWRLGQGISFWQGNQKRYVVDNTIYDVHGGILANFSGPITMSGNLISDIDAADAFISIYLPAQNSVANIDYSLMYDSENDFRIIWNGNPYTSMASFQSTSGGQCSNCVVGDPSFIDAANNDYRLGNNSAGKSMNNDTLDVYSTFFNLYGIDIRRDPAGKARPVSGGSVGVYEAIGSAGGGTQPPVLAPLTAPVLNTPQVN